MVWDVINANLSYLRTLIDYRRERQSYVSRAGGDEGGQD